MADFNVALSAGAGVTPIDLGADLRQHEAIIADRLSNEGRQLDNRSKGLSVADQQGQYDAFNKAGNPNYSLNVDKAVMDRHVMFGQSLMPQLDALEAMPDGPEKIAAWKQTIQKGVDAGVIPPEAAPQIANLPPTPEHLAEARKIAQSLVDPKSYTTTPTDPTKQGLAVSAVMERLIKAYPGDDPATLEARARQMLNMPLTAEQTKLLQAAPPPPADQNGGMLSTIGNGLSAAAGWVGDKLGFNNGPAAAAPPAPEAGPDQPGTVVPPATVPATDGGAAMAPPPAPPAAPAPAASPIPTQRSAIAPPGFPPDAPAPKTQAEFDALPDGAAFWNTDGRPMIKGKRGAVPMAPGK